MRWLIWVTEFLDDAEFWLMAVGVLLIGLGVLVTALHVWGQWPAISLPRWLWAGGQRQ